MKTFVILDGIKYIYTKDHNSNGYWYATTGRSANMVVPIHLSAKLTNEALNSGVDQSVFSNKGVSRRVESDDHDDNDKKVEKKKLSKSIPILLMKQKSE